MHNFPQCTHTLGKIGKRSSLVEEKGHCWLLGYVHLWRTCVTPPVRRCCGLGLFSGTDIRRCLVFAGATSCSASSGSCIWKTGRVTTEMLRCFLRVSSAMLASFWRSSLTAVPDGCHGIQLDLLLVILTSLYTSFPCSLSLSLNRPMHNISMYP